MGQRLPVSERPLASSDSDPASALSRPILAGPPGARCQVPGRRGTRGHHHGHRRARTSESPARSPLARPGATVNVALAAIRTGCALEPLACKRESETCSVQSRGRSPVSEGYCSMLSEYILASGYTANIASHCDVLARPMCHTTAAHIVRRTSLLTRVLRARRGIRMIKLHVS